MSLAMSRTERESFLAGLHVGIIALPDEQRGPVTVPIWYAYTPGGELHFVTERSSKKGRLLREGVHISLCAQSEEVPYKYVSVEGPVVKIEASDLERDVRPIARRYLGPAMGDGYIEATRAERETSDSMLVRMQPERWLSMDFGKQLGES